MKTGLVVFALAALAFTGLALAEKPVVKPYAAGAPSGGIPIWNPGEKFVGVAGGTCSGNCPVYELYVFDDGRVVFVGRKDTGKVGVWNKKVAPEVYAELLTTIVRTKVLDEEIKRGTCLKGRSMLMVMRSASGRQRHAHAVAEFRLREDTPIWSGEIEKQFIVVDRGRRAGSRRRK